MKILFISTWYPSRQNRNDGVFVREHAKSVRSAGDEVVVLHLASAPPDGRGRWELEEEADPTLTEGIGTWHLRVRPFRPIARGGRPAARLAFWATSFATSWAVLRSIRRIRRLGFRPQVIHANVFTAGTPAVVAGRVFRLPVVATEHYTGFGRRTLTAGEAKRARFALGRMACVMPVCEYLRRAMEAYGVRARYEIVPNAVDTTLFFPPEHESRSHGPARLLFVGGLEPTHHKGFPVLVDALSRLRDRESAWRLDVIGDGATRPEYEKLVAEAGLADDVIFHGWKPKTLVAEAMRAADLFVLSSRFENLPCVVIEAMACGLPVVATSVGGVPEMVTPDDGILVEPDDPAGLADALERMLSDVESRDRDGIAARAVARYSLEVVGRGLHAIYVSVAGRAAVS
jgi:L-malate glycosyltransferase